MRDAVEVHHPGDLLQLAADLRLVDVVARPRELDLLRRERDEADAALERPPAQGLGDAADALDAGRIVDRAGSAPHGVVVRRHHDVLVAVARHVGNDVALAQTRQEPAADLHPHAHPVAQPLRVACGEEGGGRRRHVHVRRHERDRAPAERARQEARALPAVGVDDGERRELPVADGRRALADLAHRPFAVERGGVSARSSRPALPLDLDERLVRLVPEQVELLEARLEPELAERVRDDVGGSRGRVAAGGARPDVGCERLDQVHARESKSRRGAAGDRPA
ncbi:MAG TPA: hypothetical protein VFA05_01295 [Gaiellaceae bacterium]|nr:hypothetical protein [Gaiellaceae bacterium]